MANSDIKRLNNSIEELSRMIRGIPYFATEKITSDQLKNELTPILDDVKKNLSELDHISQNLEAVRNQIIDPVRGIIQESSELNKWGFVVGVLGIVISFITMVVGWFIPDNMP